MLFTILYRQVYNCTLLYICSSRQETLYANMIKDTVSADPPRYELPERHRSAMTLRLLIEQLPALICRLLLWAVHLAVWGYRRDTGKQFG